MPIPAGVTVGWPGTAASIPSGWTRVTALDARYLKGVPNASTDPGTTGGTTAHSHSQSHQHSYTHTHSGKTSATSTSGEFVPSGIGSGHARDHSHSIPTSEQNSSLSSSSSISLNGESNDQDRLDVIWIASDGTPEEMPSGTLAFAGSSLPSGWSVRTDTPGRYLKGASTSGDGGSVVAGNSSHSHTLSSHNHSTTHFHLGDFSGQASGSSFTNINAFGSAISFSTGNHTHDTQHQNASANSNSRSTHTATAGTSAEPEFHIRPIIESPGSRLVPGIIAVWTQPLAQIPDGWVLCDGTNGTPNLLDRFLKGSQTNLSDIGTTGGSTTHGHTGLSHSHTASSHTHPLELGPSNTITANATPNDVGPIAYGNHQSNHALTSNATTASLASTTISPNNATGVEPPFSTVAFIQFQGSPVNVRTGGAWVEAMPRMRIGGAWTDALAHARVSGAWT